MSISYTIACRDLSGDCDFVATAPTLTDAKRAFWGHVWRDHANLTAFLAPGMRVELERQMDGIVDGRPR